MNWGDVFTSAHSVIIIIIVIQFMLWWSTETRGGQITRRSMASGSVHFRRLWLGCVSCLFRNTLEVHIYHWLNLYSTEFKIKGELNLENKWTLNEQLHIIK